MIAILHGGPSGPKAVNSYEVGHSPFAPHGLMVCWTVMATLPEVVALWRPVPTTHQLLYRFSRYSGEVPHYQLEAVDGEKVLA